jgi:hypothetical protein
VSDEPSRGELAPLAVELLVTLHAHKTVGYGNAWRKRGELLSIFTNLARKYDRLVVALDEGIRSGDERLPDTAGDLCVYAAKYLTWLAEQHPDAFDEASGDADSAKCADDGTTAPVARILRQLDVAATGDVATCWSQVRAAFRPLDVGLVAQAESTDTHAVLDWDDKVGLAWGLAAAAASLLVALATDEPDTWFAWRNEIEALG